MTPVEQEIDRIRNQHAYLQAQIQAGAIKGDEVGHHVAILHENARAASGRIKAANELNRLTDFYSHRLRDAVERSKANEFGLPPHMQSLMNSLQPPPPQPKPDITALWHQETIAASVLGGVIAGQSSAVVSRQPIVHSQGMTRGYWRGPVGRHPGYVR